MRKQVRDARRDSCLIAENLLNFLIKRAIAIQKHPAHQYHTNTDKHRCEILPSASGIMKSWNHRAMYGMVRPSITVLGEADILQCSLHGWLRWPLPEVKNSNNRCMCVGFDDCGIFCQHLTLPVLFAISFFFTILFFVCWFFDVCLLLSLYSSGVQRVIWRMDVDVMRTPSCWHTTKTVN